MGWEGCDESAEWHDRRDSPMVLGMFVDAVLEYWDAMGWWKPLCNGDFVIKVLRAGEAETRNTRLDPGNRLH
jgi:hypothetical protein